MSPPRVYIYSSITDSTGLEIHELLNNEFIPCWGSPISPTLGVTMLWSRASPDLNYLWNQRGGVGIKTQLTWLYREGVFRDPSWNPENSSHLFSTQLLYQNISWKRNSLAFCFLGSGENDCGHVHTFLCPFCHIFLSIFLLCTHALSCRLNQCLFPRWPPKLQRRSRTTLAYPDSFFWMASVCL